MAHEPLTFSDLVYQSAQRYEENQGQSPHFFAKSPLSEILGLESERPRPYQNDETKVKKSRTKKPKVEKEVTPANPPVSNNGPVEEKPKSRKRRAPSSSPSKLNNGTTVLPQTLVSAPPEPKPKKQAVKKYEVGDSRSFSCKKCKASFQSVPSIVHDAQGNPKFSTKCSSCSASVTASACKALQKRKIKKEKPVEKEETK